MNIHPAVIVAIVAGIALVALAYALRPARPPATALDAISNVAGAIQRL